ncbi:CBS domain-containing protein [Aliagarivorans marinus]|uniref:CBS domain-containing protein n=1 Tax=Aliagarivorans marinus TaxID=561965 RepID=UPI00041BC9F6|nr:CBS domain-containing protein [Aliagarivorans marinus]
MQDLSVKQYMRRQFLSFTPETSISDISHALVESGQLGAPVVNQHKQLVGWVSERDCLVQMLQAGYYCDQTALAKDLMKPEVLSVSPETSILDLARQMTDDKPKVYPVVENQRIIGLIDRSMVLKVLDQQQQQCFKHQA